MILRAVTPINWGPFNREASLIVEPDVTILTAPNDAGKSSLLRLIDIAYRLPGGSGAQEDDLNIDYRESSNSSEWESDQDFGCLLTFIVKDSSIEYIRTPNSAKQIKAGDEIRFFCLLSPGIKKVSIDVLRGGSSISDINYPYIFKKLPHIIGLPTGHEIGNIINLSKPNHAERLLLQVAFGVGFDSERIEGYGRPQYLNAVRQAEKRLNSAASKVIPPSLKISFVLQPTGNQGEIAILPYDQEFGSAPL